MEINLPPSDVNMEVNTMFDMSQVPETAKVKNLGIKCRELILLDEQIKIMEEELEKKKNQRSRITRHELPDIFNECKMDSIGVPGEDVDVVLEPFFHANIKADWPEEQRDEAFDILEKLGAEDIIRVTMYVHFGKGEIELAKEMQEFLRSNNKFGNRPIRIERNVPWNTLTAWVKDRVKKHLPTPLTEIGASIGSQCKIVKRKTG